ncbi:MAG: GH25 family lysozyme [Deltaproteobacteria bacterium]|nr:GH25 family lysozyme [Deltaproteobacteria bacterium]
MRTPQLVLVAALALAACNDRDLAAGSLLTTSDPQAEQAIHAVCPAGETTYGIDVSYYQGNIDWAQVAGAGVQYAIIRTTDGLGYQDSKFAQNWAGAKANGITRGVYQFWRSDEDPIAQADLMLSMMGPLEPGDLPPTVDVESTDGVDNATRAVRLQQWLDHVEAALGVTPMIYTGGYFWQSNVARDFSRYPLWHAGYTGGSCPSTVANEWADWTFWQFGSTGRVPGISGDVDENRFNGSLAQLQELARRNHMPRGSVDGATCEGVRGWTQDEDTADVAIDAHVYLDLELFVVAAGGHRDDLCAALGSCAHAWETPIPLAFRDGADHTVVVWGIDDAGQHSILPGSGAVFRCDPPALPAGTLRHIQSGEAMTAWGFSFGDVAVYADDVVTALPEGSAWTPAPRLVRADGAPEVYVVDAGVRRHVPNGESFVAWGFSDAAIEVLPAVDVDALTLGAPLRQEPFLLRGAGPAVYLLDVEASSDDVDDNEAPTDDPDDVDGPDGVVDDEPADDDGDDDAPRPQRFIVVEATPACCAATPMVPTGMLLIGLLRRRRRYCRSMSGSCRSSR